MARQIYKQKPLFWECVQYNGTNWQEMVSFCPECTYDNQTKVLLFNGMTVDATNWVLKDNAGRFSMRTNDEFVAFFQLSGGGPPA